MKDNFARDTMYREIVERVSGTPQARRTFSIVGILALGLLGYSLLVIFQDAPPKVAAKRIAAPVTVVELSPVSVPASIRGYGTVSAHRELILRPEVMGTVVEVGPTFQQGGRVAAGELLFQIDPRDYEIALQEARSQLERALFDLKLEEGNQVVAQREWKLLRKGGQASTALSEELALRKPHLREKKAQVDAAKSRVTKAELDLERTKLIAPFDIIVLSESVEIGRYVSPQENVGTIAATDAFEVEVQVSRGDLRWVPQLLSGRETSLPASITQRVSNDLAVARTGQAIRLLGDVDSAGRMARVLVLIPNPLDVSDESELPLLIGSYVEVVLEGKEIDSVYVIPRRAIREGGEVWTVSPKEELRKIKVSEIASTAKQVYVRGELPEKARVVTNALPGALEGMPVAILEQGQTPNDQ